MKTVEQFLINVGRQSFRRALEIPEQSLTRAVSENVMPAGWYAGARDYCLKHQCELPEYLFRWHDRQRRVDRHGSADSTKSSGDAA